MGGPAPGDWPLSAAATTMLREPRSSAPSLVSLSVRELVARAVVDARLGPARRWRPQSVLLSPGTAPVGRGTALSELPRPLPIVAAALLARLEPDGTDATEAVRACLGKKRELLGRVRDDTRSELLDRRLLHVERDRALGVLPRTRVRRTPSGQAWAASASAVGPGVELPAVGLLLALDPAVRRAFQGRDDDPSLHLYLWMDDPLSGALDSAVDSGVGSSDGGDGGGGD